MAKRQPNETPQDNNGGDGTNTEGQTATEATTASGERSDYYVANLRVLMPVNLTDPQTVVDAAQALQNLKKAASPFTVVALDAGFRRLGPDDVKAI